MIRRGGGYKKDSNLTTSSVMNFILLLHVSYNIVSILWMEVMIFGTRRACRRERELCRPIVKGLPKLSIYRKILSSCPRKILHSRQQKVVHPRSHSNSLYLTLRAPGSKEGLTLIVLNSESIRPIYALPRIALSAMNKLESLVRVRFQKVCCFLYKKTCVIAASNNANNRSRGLQNKTPFKIKHAGQQGK